MPTPSFEQLVPFREDDVDSWNSGDKERFAASWRQFLADDDGSKVFALRSCVKQKRRRP